MKAEGMGSAVFGGGTKECNGDAVPKQIIEGGEEDEDSA